MGTRKYRAEVRRERTSVISSALLRTPVDRQSLLPQVCQKKRDWGAEGEEKARYPQPR
jgi:hypothetical protein